MCGVMSEMDSYKYCYTYNTNKNNTFTIGSGYEKGGGGNVEGGLRSIMEQCWGKIGMGG